MYKVVTMLGDNEPWWFFEDWEEDIETAATFDTFEAAALYYETQWHVLFAQFEHLQARKNYLCAFWNDDNNRWCEECDDYLQQYKGLALLKDGQAVSCESRKELYEAANSSGKAKRCKRPQQGAWC